MPEKKEEKKMKKSNYADKLPYHFRASQAGCPEPKVF
jgi:dissimilatory sulfite reductase (desulfoviridin) alpha/beta subunit